MPRPRLAAQALLPRRPPTPAAPPGPLCPAGRWPGSQLCPSSMLSAGGRKIKASPLLGGTGLFGLFMFITSCPTPLGLYCGCCHRCVELERACWGAWRRARFRKAGPGGGRAGPQAPSAPDTEAARAHLSPVGRGGPLSVCPPYRKKWGPGAVSLRSHWYRNCGVKPGVLVVCLKVVIRRKTQRRSSSGLGRWAPASCQEGRGRAHVIGR